MKTRNYLYNARTSAGWRLCVTVAGMLLSALAWQSCAGNKKVTKENYLQTDSVVERLTTVVTPLTVPRSQAGLRLNAVDLSRMPAGSRYTAQSGQARLEAYQDGDTVYIYAVCDSLTLLVESQYREIDRLKRVIELKEKETVKPTPWREKASYVSIGIVLTIIIQIVWKVRMKTRK